MSTIKKGILYLDTPIEDIENDYVISKVNLNNLAKEKIAPNNTMEGILLERTFTPFNTDGNNNMNMKFDLNYDNDEEKLVITGTVMKKEKELFSDTYDIDPHVLVDEILKSLAANKNKNVSVSNAPSITKGVNIVKENLYSKAFEENILLSNEEFNYRIDIYKAGTNNLLGIANRLLIQNDIMMLFEVIAFDTETSFSKIDIKVILNENEAIIFKSLNLNSENGKSIKYCSYNLNDSKIAKKNPSKDETYNAEKLKLKGLKLPNKDMSTNYLVEELIKQNDQSTLIKCYKQNKKMNIIKVNINKYLLS